MSRYTWRQWAYIGAAMGCVQFFVLTILAMVFFPGGTLLDHNSIGYNFWTNFFSDLGGTVTHSGASNSISSVLFLIALTVIGISFIPFLTAVPNLFTKSRFTRYLSIMGSALGMYSAICYVGIAFTPWNIDWEGHVFFVGSAFLSIVVVAIIFAIAMHVEKGFPKGYPAIFVIFTAIVIIYAWLLIFGPKFTTPEGNIIQAVGQKVVVYSMIICFAIQAHGALQVSLQKQAASSITTAIPT
jgi:hypothetical protein